MADSKLSSLTALGAAPATNDLIYIDDVSATTSKSMTVANLFTSPTFTGTVVIPTPFTLGAVSVLPTGTELNFVDGVTSAIQTQLDSKQATISFGTGVQTALGVNVGSAGAPALFNGALGTPSSGVATNITGLPAAAILPGTLASGLYLLAENASIGLDPAGSADGKYSGITITGTGGATIAFGRMVYLKAADSQWYECDADAIATSGVMVGMTATTTTDNNPVTILLIGQIRADASFPDTMTVGAPVYIGETVGAIQQAIPTGADAVIRCVGFALTTDEIYFNPSQDNQTVVA